MEFFIAILPPHRNFQQPFLFDSLPLLFVTGCSARSANKSQGRVPRGWLNKRNFLGSLSLHSSSFVIVLILNFFIFFSCRVAPAISPPAGNNRLNISVSTNINKNPVRTPLSLSLPSKRKLNREYLQFGSFFFIFAFQSFFFIRKRRRREASLVGISLFGSRRSSENFDFSIRQLQDDGGWSLGF